MATNKKFSIADLAAFTALVSVFLAGTVWIRESEVLNSTNYIPLLVPIDFVFELGFGFAPFFGLALLLTVFVLLVRVSPGPYTVFLYLAFLAVGFTITDPAITRHFVTLLIVSISSVLECGLRNRSASWIAMSMITFGITLCYYLIVIASAACLSLR